MELCSQGKGKDYQVRRRAIIHIVDVRPVAAQSVMSLI
jgi:hypothetical protein